MKINKTLRTRESADTYSCTNLCKLFRGKTQNKRCIAICKSIIEQSNKKRPRQRGRTSLCKHNKTKRDIKKDLRRLKKQVLAENRCLAKTIKKMIRNGAKKQKTNKRRSTPKSLMSVTKKQLSRQVDSALGGLITNCKIPKVKQTKRVV
jgi:hypothetical protein